MRRSALYPLIWLAAPVAVLTLGYWAHRETRWDRAKWGLIGLASSLAVILVFIAQLGGEDTCIDAAAALRIDPHGGWLAAPCFELGMSSVLRVVLGLGGIAFFALIAEWILLRVQGRTVVDEEAEDEEAEAGSGTSAVKNREEE